MDTPIFEKKNVLVTGGAGFIGSHLCERLLKESKVICLDNFSNSDPRNINHLLQYPDFEFINWDINQPFDPDKFDELDKFKVKFQGIQEIYHLACPTNPKNFENNRIDNLKSASDSMFNSLNLAVRYKAKYVFTSSAVVYGPSTPERRSIKEAELGTFDHLSARACYDEGRRFAETCVSTFAQVFGLDAKIARVFTTYGTRMKLFEEQLIPDFIINAIEGKDLVIYGDEKFGTSLCYVTDMADGLVRLMSAPPEIKLVNLGGDEMVLYVDVAKMIVKLTNSQSKLVFEKPLLFLSSKGTPDTRYATENLGWMPLVRLEDGLQKAIDYVMANKEALMFDGDEK